MSKFFMSLAALAAFALAASFQPVDAIQVQERQQVQEREHQEATDSIQGTIASRENGVFVVTTHDGERMHFHTDQRTRVEDPQNRSLQALDAGESILVHYRAVVTDVQLRDHMQMDPQERERIERERQERMAVGQQDQPTDSIHGTLAERENGAFTLMTERGERKTFHLQEEEGPLQEREQVMAQHRAMIEQLQEGQEITVHYRAVATSIEVRPDGQDPRPQEQERQEWERQEQERQERERQEREPMQPEHQQLQQQQRADSLEGTVAERENGTFVITTAEGERINLHTDEQTRVGVWQERDLGALSAGESIVVHYRAIATRVEPADEAWWEMDPQERQRMERERAERERAEPMERDPQQQDHATDSIQGTLGERENGAFTIVTETGERKTFHLEDRAGQMQPPAQPQVQQEVDLDRFQEGQRVTVHYRVVAERIELRQDTEQTYPPRPDGLR